ncbi:MAG TPA: FAD-dependent oxidoreductase [Bryobacteraceae bacterium]|jgi:glycine/D-amino acid oxidase-like deaminating enzyme|nr:FAD-dependent oxidoreductase [Bryobacteraceae bacterium]
MAGTYEALIIGGGIVGAACAYELARAGLRVAIVEEHGIASGATSAGMGHLVVLDDSEAQFSLARRSLELWRELAQDLPADCEYRQCGTVWVAANEQELELARGKVESYTRGGVEAALVDARQLLALEPNLREGLAGGLLVPGDATVHPASAARFLTERSGARVIIDCVVTVLDGQVRLSGGDSLTAGVIVNATGTGAALLTPGLPVRARKGHIVVADPGLSFARHQIVELGYVQSTHAEEGDSVVFNVRQDRNGELLIGSSRQYDANDPSIEPAVIDRMLARALEYMPALARARQLRSWTGFRAGTPDGLPLIGCCSGFERFFVAAGHEGLGATTSLATARLIADQILGRPPEIEAAPFHPARFERQTM